MNWKDAFTPLASRHRREIVVCGIGTAATGWQATTEAKKVYFKLSTMGMTSAFSMGVALGLPQATVWGIEGDGGLCMNLDCLLMLADVQPANLRLFLASNRCYGAIGDLAIPNVYQTDYVGLARAAGIRRAYRFADAAEFAAQTDEILGGDGFAFTVLEIDYDHIKLPASHWEGPEIKYRFARHIEEQEGVTIFGPAGF